ncbi:MAG TPA: hypothetical protein VK249_15730 [Anaerolineales bacterium]|nr:hypothetical protein [Anaerolineales bacterium]
MNDQMNAPVPPQPVQPASSGNERIMAIASLVVGVLSLCGLVVPLMGVPLGLVGIVLGYFGRKDVNWKTYAAAGMALSVVGILLSCVPIAAITVMRLLGPKVGSTFSSISNSLP